ncbi:MAG: aldo/keto reductase [Defluviitaleaceae bacterium]|nr:aldo/keto reductase [Defluviitaleaceae bacterium]
MQYRAFGKLNFEVSTLGMGCMRLPFIDENDGSKGVNRDKAYELIRYAVDNGITYFDTAYGYHATDSEAVLGEALEEGGRRAKVKIATKQPFGVMTTQADIRRNLENTLKKLRTDHVDIYLLHCIMQPTWQEIQKREIFAEFEKFKAEGLIKHIGFSYHGQFPTFKEVVERYPWEMCLIQQNLLDVNREVTEQAIYTANKHNMAVAIMEPLRGGGLTKAPKVVADLYENFPIKRQPTEWAFRHLVNYPEVSTVVSGMTTLEQLKDNLAMFSQPDMKASCLTDDEKKLIAAAREGYESIVTIPCTGCNYCVPCPQNVEIPRAFALYNDAHRFGHFDQPRRSYMFTRRANRDASFCTACGVCIDKCPQEINIPEDLKVAHAALDGWEE